ncbi:MAG: MarR family winged helix-turn-helix transcriptional regulator [Vitreimonas sp.]
MTKRIRSLAPKAPNNGENLTEFAMALYQLVETVRAEHEEAAASVGLTAAQASILAMLSEPKSMRELADRMGCDASNITGLVDRLEAKALVVRAADPADRRVKRISHTTAGKAAVQRFQRELVRVSSLAELAPAAKSTLLAALAQVRRPK